MIIARVRRYSKERPLPLPSVVMDGGEVRHRACGRERSGRVELLGGLPLVSQADDLGSTPGVSMVLRAMRSGLLLPTMSHVAP